jgi:hypothetical protein
VLVELAGVRTSTGVYCVACANCYLAPVHCQVCYGNATKNYASLGRRHKPCGPDGIFVGWDTAHERVQGITCGNGRLVCCYCDERLPGEEDRLALL